jgi:hypothetical protein
MKIITTEKELLEYMDKDKPMPPSVMVTGGYGDLRYDCSCGQSHGVNTVVKIACYRPIKFMFKCSKGFYTLVRIKGILSQKAESEWGCDGTLLNNYVSKRGL